MTKTYRIYGIDGHRQHESFSPSKTFRTWAGDETTIEAALWGQISDGIFERCRVGKVESV